MKTLSRFVSSVFRRRFYTVSGIAEVYKPWMGSKLLEKLIGKYLQSDLPRKIKVAKGFYTLEMAPPTSRNELKQLKEDLKLAMKFIKSGCINELTVKQAWLLFLIGVEICMWFYMGEVIGKMHIVGYKV